MIITSGDRRSNGHIRHEPDGNTMLRTPKPGRFMSYMAVTTPVAAGNDHWETAAKRAWWLSARQVDAV
ncbi:MAG: hypothetical protein ACLQPI_09800, partial [Limisphaerales bacterium]